MRCVPGISEKTSGVPEVGKAPVEGGVGGVGYSPSSVGLASVIDVGDAGDSNVVHTASAVSLGVSSIDVKQIEEKSDLISQATEEKLDSENTSVQSAAETDGQSVNSGSKVDAETVEHPGDWLTHTGKRRASSNKRPPTSRLAGGLSAAFTAKDNSPEEDTFLLDEELETSDRPTPKENLTVPKRSVVK